MTDTTSHTQESEQDTTPGPVGPKDHWVSGEPKVPGTKPERDAPEARKSGEDGDGEVGTEDHWVSGEPKEKPGPIAPVDHWVS
ncbi:hypothetical protein [Streptomyces profundus]|uniref:hypothetical protein n=1 Tax=Streptomyces profundus TaxID=2867410 RepID=UPI001D1610D2|nr:hypothetical protein [Streptomyces sp. MA3_2.13]UED85787.1 hypothetical protein K4G22_17615 [Streptomyces sp. MA3_2.13]